MTGFEVTTGEGLAREVALELRDRPDSRRAWVYDIVDHLDVLMVLARKDFQTRYKRASLGLTWAVVVPLLQGSIMAVVFSHVVRAVGGSGYTAYVMSGIFAFSYFSQTLGAAVTSIVDGASLTDKVWFPRIILVIVPALANLVGLIVSFAFLLAVLPLVGGRYTPHLFLVPVALTLLVMFTEALALVLSALYVYFRDVRFFVQASLLVWMYLTPIIYPIGLVHRFEPIIIANPLTGIVSLLHLGILGTSHGALLAPLLVSLGATVILVAVGLEAQRSRDRLFADLL